MFGIDSTELLLIVVVAVIFIGPKDLPRVLYKVGQVVGQVRAMSRHFRTGIDAMIREAELEELQKQWDKQNARIMADNPPMEPLSEAKALVDESSHRTTLPAPEAASGEAAHEAPIVPPAPDKAAS